MLDIADQVVCASKNDCTYVYDGQGSHAGSRVIPASGLYNLFIAQALTFVRITFDLRYYKVKATVALLLENIRRIYTSCLEES